MNNVSPSAAKIEKTAPRNAAEKMTLITYKLIVFVTCFVETPSCAATFRLPRLVIRDAAILMAPRSILLASLFKQEEEALSLTGISVKCGGIKQILLREIRDSG